MSSAIAGVDTSGTPGTNSAQRLLDLQRVSKIAQRLTGGQSVETLARTVTDGLVAQFDCALARIWVVELEAAGLRLVASSGLYTHTNGSFARVPMGAYKVGKIAQNRVPFLSNRLAEETWVKDRNWAIANRIQGFAGYPLIADERVIGVLATFSHGPMAAEFLEVLQVICMTTTIALDAALQAGRPAAAVAPRQSGVLSDQLAALLTPATLALVGTEMPLPAALTGAFLHLGELLNEFQCDYGRLVYGDRQVTLEAIVALPAGDCGLAQWQARCQPLRFVATCLGGDLQANPGPQRQMVQATLQLPYRQGAAAGRVAIACEAPLMQLALTGLAYGAGLAVGDVSEPATVLITDSAAGLRENTPVIWVRTRAARPAPPQAQAVVDEALTADQLRQIVQAVLQGKAAQPPPDRPKIPDPSERERVIMALLAEGLRDRDIAHQLFISESTVKFHIHNSLAKLRAKNRYQAVYQAAIHGWI